MHPILKSILDFGPTVVTILVVAAIYYTTRIFLDRQARGKTDAGLIRGIVLFGIGLVGLIAVIMALPMGDDLRGQITSLIGIVISAVLALSSATFIGNAIAGIMLQAVNNFSVGDFIKVEDNFGRVTERGLFHTEIQTENSDLLTLPNLFLATNPVKVTRSSGTFISGICSLGYDVNHKKIEKALIKATEMTGLKDGFVRIQELGDFSVVYQVYGMITDVKTILSTESRLNGNILDALHEADIEIVSPNFMNQRPVGDTIFIPKKIHAPVNKKPSESPEDKIFEKADEAESLEKEKSKIKETEEKIKAMSEELKAATDEETKAKLEKKIEKLKDIKERRLDRADEKATKMNEKK